MKNNKEAIDLLKSILNKGDIILIKGSRGMKLEEIVSFYKRGDKDASINLRNHHCFYNFFILDLSYCLY